MLSKPSRYFLIAVAAATAVLASQGTTTTNEPNILLSSPSLNNPQNGEILATSTRPTGRPGDNGSLGKKKNNLPPQHTVTDAPVPYYEYLHRRADDDKKDDDDDDDDAMPTLTDTSSKLPTPKVTVPPMNNNPYLSKSSLPEGTVFIAVGAILGGLGLAIVGWRMASAISLRRSLRRAENNGPTMSSTLLGDDKALLYPGDPSRAGDVYHNNNSLSSDNLKSNHHKSTLPSGGGHNLFFSPTAEVMNSAKSSGGNNDSFSSTIGNNFQPQQNHQQRSSVYLPAGYYTPGNNGVQNSAASMTSRTTRAFSMHGGGGHRDSMAGGNTTPSLRASSYMPPTNNSTSGLAPPTNNQSRAPSAYLDDLLKHDSD